MPQIIKRVDALVEAGIYSNRNEAIRDAVRRMVYNYEALSRTSVLREEVSAKLKGKSASRIIREGRDEEARGHLGACCRPLQRRGIDPGSLA